MWTDILIFGGIWFWIAVAIVFIMVTSFIESSKDYDVDTNGTGATLTLLGFAAAYYFLGSSEHIKDLIHYLKINPFTIISFLAAYLVVGVAWSFAKWYFFLKAKANYFKKEAYSKDEIRREIPKASRHKGNIIAWMCYWPFSMLFTILSKSIKDAFEFIYEHLENSYNNVAKKIFGDLMDDTKK